MIALVISIIVMLILAGVSINAIVGDDGILSRTQYSTFLSEMTAVEEAVQMWKAGEVIGTRGDETKEIPANGLCKVNDLTSTERLAGEIGYYRIWSMSEKAPEMSIFSSASEFNGKFESEMIYYPAGVQDLYYINNEAVGIEGDKTYIIDAATGMIYSMAGVTLKGISCYSANMATAVMMGNLNAPIFAEAEVSGTGDKLAGNVQDEYLEDGTKNPDYKEYGFQIIADSTNDNVYKLYNNGDLYAKGIKGTTLTTSIEKMDKINPYKWVELKIPSEIGSYKKVITSGNSVYVIDTNGYLWSWGNNSNNKLGLTQEQQVEFTGRDPIKLNVDEKKVENVWDLNNVLFVLTEDNCLYSCGYNQDYFLGLGHNQEVTKFENVEFSNPKNIKTISRSGEGAFVLIECKDNTYYVTGRNAKIIDGTTNTGAYTKFVPIWNGYMYKEINGNYEIDEKTGYLANIDIDQDIKQLSFPDVRCVFIVKKDGKLMYVGAPTYCGTSTIKNTYEIQTFSEEFGNDVKGVYGLGHGVLILQNNGKVWGSELYAGSIGLDYIEMNIIELSLPVDLLNSGIKEIVTFNNSAFWLSNNNELFVSSNSVNYVTSTNIEKMQDSVKLKSIVLDDYNFQGVNYERNAVVRSDFVTAIGENGKIYGIGNSTIVFRNDILQGSWDIIAKHVDKVAIANESIAYIDKNNKNLYVLGNDARKLGLKISERKKIEKFTLVDDTLINGKVKDVCFTPNQMYVLTTDNILYGTGIWSDDGTTDFSSHGWPGWSEHENKYNLIKILDDVRMVSVSNFIRVAVTSNSYYTWGYNYGGVIRASDWTPQIYNINSILNPSDINRIYAKNAFIGILSNDNKFYTNGSSYATTVFPISLNNTSFKERANDFFHFESTDEYVIDFCMMDNTAALVLTNKGNVYGWGQSNKLGINSSLSTVVSSPVKVINRVKQVVSGNGYFIVVKDDGTVWGTGTNTNGVLGRWIGIDRRQPNSRYKTAFEWVECPELEI